VRRCHDDGRVTYDAHPIDQTLTGMAVAINERGWTAGIDEVNRTAWLSRGEGVEFISHTTHELIASGMNASGVVVGHQGERDVARAFLFDDQMRDLQALLGSEFARARDISDSGVVVGARRNSATLMVAYRYDTVANELTSIPFAAGLGADYVMSEAVAVTDDGTLAAGLAWQAFSANPRGFLYDHSTGTTTDLGTTILPRAANNNKRLAGTEWPTGETVTYNIVSHTTRLHGSRLLVEAMNDQGDLVGSMTGGGDLPSAFIVRPGQLAVDLNSEVPAVQGWIVGATDITNDGRILVNARLTNPTTGAGFGRPFVLRPA
jgi:uncharacterized membrane protein